MGFIHIQAIPPQHEGFFALQRISMVDEVSLIENEMAQREGRIPRTFKCTTKINSDCITLRVKPTSQSNVVILKKKFYFFSENNTIATAFPVCSGVAPTTFYPVASISTSLLSSLKSNKQMLVCLSPSSVELTTNSPNNLIQVIVGLTFSILFLTKVFLKK